MKHVGVRVEVEKLFAPNIAALMESQILLKLPL